MVHYMEISTALHPTQLRFNEDTMSPDTDVIFLPSHSTSSVTEEGIHPATLLPNRRPTSQLNYGMFRVTSPSQNSDLGQRLGPPGISEPQGCFFEAIRRGLQLAGPNFADFVDALQDSFWTSFQAHSWGAYGTAYQRGSRTNQTLLFL